MKRLMLIRHGESEWNAHRRLQGQADIELSELGRRQAAALRSTIEALAADAAVTSDLKRAFETAIILGLDEARAEPGLREIDVGEWTGQPIASIEAENPDGYLGWRAGSYTPPKGEDWSDFSARTNDCVRRALSVADRLLVVCHGGVIRAILETMIGLAPRQIIPVGPASLTILAERPAGSGRMRLELFNFSPLGPILDAPD